MGFDVRDARGVLQLPPAQQDDAKKKYAEQETATVNAVRSGVPHQVHAASPNTARGFDQQRHISVSFGNG